MRKKEKIKKKLKSVPFGGVRSFCICIDAAIIVSFFFFFLYSGNGVAFIGSPFCYLLRSHFLKVKLKRIWFALFFPRLLSYFWFTFFISALFAAFMNVIFVFILVLFSSSIKSAPTLIILILLDLIWSEADFSRIIKAKYLIFFSPFIAGFVMNNV